MPPPIRPPPGIGLSFFGFSATIASVVISSPATEAASCRAVRTTLVGSMMPPGDQIAELAGLGVEAPVVVGALEQLADDHRAVDAGILGDLPRRRLKRLADDVDAEALVVVGGLDPVERLERVAAAPRRHPGRCPPRPRRWSHASRRRRGPCAP